VRLPRIRRRDAKAWFDQHRQAFADREDERISAEKWWDRRVEATWGLIRLGEGGAPFAIEMLASGNPDIREDGAGILAEIGRDERAVDALLAALGKETHDQPRDGLIAALGRMKSQRAIPYLAQLIRSAETDGDTRWEAVLALGQIVRRRFDRQPDPERAAIAWLDEHGR
jgi:HEAT repeat protein